MAIPSELFRFRIVRGVQPQQLKPGSAIDLASIPNLPLSAADVKSYQPKTLVNPATWQHWLAGLSSELNTRGDLVEPAGVIALLPSDWKNQVADSAWGQTQSSLAVSLVSAMKGLSGEPTPEQVFVIEGLCRLLRVQALVTLLYDDTKAATGQQALHGARDVQNIATHGIVVLPSSFFVPRRPGLPLIRRPGFTDLYVVRDEWNRYEAGELARVLNVLPGETFETRLKHFEKTETLVSKTTETTTSQETENSKTQSTSLSESSTKDASLNIGVQGQVEVSGQYGMTHVQTSLAAQLQSAKSDSENRAFTTAVETVQRAVKHVSQTVIQVQSTRTVTGDVDSEDHKLANSDSTPTVGLYRWLSEVHRVQLESFPNRFVLEFEVPEPGAWLRWAMQNSPKTTNHPDPGPFRLADADKDLSPVNISQAVADQLAARWRIQGLTTVPAETLTISTVLRVDPTEQGKAIFVTASDNSLTVPDGYRADKWNADIFASRNWEAGPNFGTQLTVTVGGSANVPAAGGGSGQKTTGDLGTGDGGAEVHGSLGGSVGFIDTGTIPVTVYAIALEGFTCVVNITCTLSPVLYRQWQQTTFDQIAAAYDNLLSAYQQELAAAAQQPGSLAGLIGPPDLNRQRAVDELRRLVIESLMGKRFEGEPAIDLSQTDSEPSVNLTEAATDGPIVQFFEQAFEWENITYICYPYYWARNTVWPTDALAATADPEFDRFLNSGSARVVVPTRPGFENMVNYYLYTGVVWGGLRPPAPNDPDYLSIAQEIQSLETGATDGTPVGSSWEVSLPTTLLWAGDDPSKLPTNTDPTIPAPTK